MSWVVEVMWWIAMGALIAAMSIIVYELQWRYEWRKRERR